ncbi:MAG: hypothetical protein JWR01_474, partial [Subtercola sp.]|nr:hypothetical protein [Subtercola sp.]
AAGAAAAGPGSPESTGTGQVKVPVGA